MFKKLLLLSLLVTSFASAKEYTPQDLRERLEVRSDIYQVDGKKVISGPERTSYMRFNPDSNTKEGSWGSSFNFGNIYLSYTWKISADGVISAVIEEFAKSDKDGKFSESIEKKEYTLESFEPIVWKVKNIKDNSYIVRFIPSIRETSKPVAVDNIPVSGTKLTVADSAGYLWASGSSLDGKYISLTTHRGTIGISYVPFKGATEMGTAEGNEINLSVDKKFKIYIKSETAFLPVGMTAKVYAVYLPETKSKGVNSVNSSSSSQEESFLSRIKR